MNYLNIKQTAQRKCIRNPSARNRLMHERVRRIFRCRFSWTKLFSLIPSFKDVFNLLNSLKFQCLPSSTKYNYTLFTDDLDIANSFDEYFPSSFNSQLYPYSVPLCPCDIFLENIVDSMTTESIYGKLLAKKTSGFNLFDNIPPLLFNLCPK